MVGAGGYAAAGLGGIERAPFLSPPPPSVDGDHAGSLRPPPLPSPPPPTAQGQGGGGGGGREERGSVLGGAIAGVVAVLLAVGGGVGCYFYGGRCRRFRVMVRGGRGQPL